MKQQKTKNKNIMLFSILFLLLGLIIGGSAISTYTDYGLWSLNNDTVVLSNISNNVNIGENATSLYKLEVNGDSAFIGNIGAYGDIVTYQDLVSYDDAIVYDNLSVYNDIDGSREKISYFYTNRLNTDQYIKINNAITTSATIGFIAPYNGSIRSINCIVYTKNIGLSSDKIYLKAYVGSSSKLSCAIDVPVSGSFSTYMSYAQKERKERGNNDFSEGNIINMYADFGSFGAWDSGTIISGCIEVQYDT